MNVHILLWENSNSGDTAKYSPATEDPLRLSRKMEEVPTVRAAGVSSEAPEGERGEFGLWHSQWIKTRLKGKLYLL